MSKNRNFEKIKEIPAVDFPGKCQKNGKINVNPDVISQEMPNNQHPAVNFPGKCKNIYNEDLR